MKVSPGITTDLVASPSIADEEISAASTTEPTITIKANPNRSIHRLLLMSYYPSGFWSRLVTRMLADDSVVEIMRSYFEIPKEVCLCIKPVYTQQLVETCSWNNYHKPITH